MKKRIFAALLAVMVMTLSLAACGSSSASSDVTQEEETADGTEETSEEETQTDTADTEESDADLSQEAAAAAQTLYAGLKAYAGTDYEAFSALYRNTSEDVIQSDYEASWPSEAQSDKQNYVAAAVSGNYCAVSVCDYIVSGTHPDTGVTSNNYCLLLSLEDGEWLIDYSDACVNALNDALYDTAYPQALVEALDAGRNAIFFGTSNYMYLDNACTFEDALYNEVKLAWQEEDGSVVIGLWIANGTDENITIESANYITLTDADLGEILNLSGTMNESVKAGYSTVLYYTVEADEVETGTQSWGSVSVVSSLKF